MTQPPNMTDQELDALVARMRGRAAFCEDRGEVKTPWLLREAADAITALRARQPTVQEAAKVLLMSGMPGDHQIFNELHRMIFDGIGAGDAFIATCRALAQEPTP